MVMKSPFKTPAAPLAGGLVLLLVWAARLSGQSYVPFREEAEAIRQQTRFRLGPLRVVPFLRLSDVGYDTNVYYSDERREAVADLTATLSPELRGYWLGGGSLIFSVLENPEYVAYARESDLRAFTNSVSASLRWLALRRFSLSAEYHDFSHVRRIQSEFEHRIRDTTRGAQGSLFFETPRGTVFGVTAAVDDFRFEDVTAGPPDPAYHLALDRRETSLAAEAYYRVFSRSYLFSRVAWSRYAFVHEVSAWRDAAAIEASGGFRFPLVGRARGTIRFGYKSFRPDDPLRRSFAGLVAGTAVTLRVGRLGVELGLDRDLAFSYLESAYYYVDTRVRAGLSLYLFRSLRIDARGGTGTMTYPEPVEVWDDGIPVLIDGRRDRQWDISVGPVLRIFRTAGFGLAYNFYRRTSNAPGFNIRRDFVGAFITYEF
jgi:hypothetical protein